METITTTAYFAILGYCAYTDVRYGIIRNYAVLALIVLGMFLTNSFLSDLVSGVPAISVFNDFLFDVLRLIAVSVFGFFVLAIMMAPGDVKLFVGISAVIGAVSMLDVLLFSLLWAIILFFTSNPYKVFSALRRVGFMVYSAIMTKKFDGIEPESSVCVMPYALCVLLAAITSYAFGGNFLTDRILALWF